MRAAAFNGSPRRDGNTAAALRAVLAPLEDAGVETRVFHVGNKTVAGCRACGWCKAHREYCCVQGDEVNEWLREMLEADAVILATPVYFGNIAGPMKCFLDRAFYVNSVCGGRLRMKPAASLAVARRTGNLTALDALNRYLLYGEMTLVGSSYWSAAFGHHPGEVVRDSEGMQVLRRLGGNLAYQMRMRADFALELPAGEERKNFNYIR